MKQAYLEGSSTGQVLADLVRDLEGTRGRQPLPDMQRAALVLLDLQRIFVDPTSPAFLPAWPGVEPRAMLLYQAFRDAGLPVIRTRHVHPPADPGGTLFHFFSRLLVDEDPLSGLAGPWQAGEAEVVIDKPRHSAFARTSLAARLGSLEADVVVLAGVQAHLCVLATAVEAGSYDILPVVAVDAVAAPTLELHRSSLRALSGGLAWLATAREIADGVAR
jgi:bifunctional isochorismate lyase/aryl carrier protein